MKIVKLPDSCRYEKSWKGADQLWSDLNEKYKLSVYISFANGSLWLRVSCNCYNTQEGFFFSNLTFVLIKNSPRYGQCLQQNCNDAQ